MPGESKRGRGCRQPRRTRHRPRARLPTQAPA